MQNLVHNTAQNSPDNLTTEPRDNQHSSDTVYRATGENVTLMYKPVFLFTIKPELESCFDGRQSIVSSLERSQPVTSVIKRSAFNVRRYQRIAKVLWRHVVVADNVQLNSSQRITHTKWDIYHQYAITYNTYKTAKISNQIINNFHSDIHQLQCLVSWGKQVISAGKQYYLPLHSSFYNATLKIPYLTLPYLPLPIPFFYLSSGSFPS